MALQLDSGRWLYGPLIGLLAAVVGLTAGISPELAIAAAFMVAFVILVIADLIWGLAAFTFLAFLEIVPFGGPALSFTKVLGLLLVLSWLTVLTTGRGALALPPGLPRTAIGVLAAFFGWVALSTMWAENPVLTIDALSRYVLNGILFVIVLTAVSTPRSMRITLGAFIAGAFVAASYGLAAPSQFEAEYGRLESAALDPNELSAVLVPAVALCTYIAVGMRERPAMRMAATVVGLMCTATVVLTVSRGGLVALAVVIVLAICLAGRWRSRIGAIAAAGAVAVAIYFAGFAGPDAVAHLESTTQGTQRVQEARTTIWQVAWRMAQANPVAGVGAGNFPATSIHYVLEPGASRRTDLIIDNPLVVHNTYLETLVELGVVGASLFLGLIGICLAALAKAIAAFKRMRDAEMEVLARGLAVALGGILVADFFISEQFSKALWLLLALAPAMLVVARRAERGRETPNGA